MSAAMPGTMPGVTVGTECHVVPAMIQRGARQVDDGGSSVDRNCG